MSPEPDQNQRVILTLLPVTKPQAPVKDWFGNQALALAQSFGKVEGATETQEQGPILSRAVKMNANGRELRSVFVGYASPHGFQMNVVLMPEGTAETDPRVQTVSNYLDQLQAAHFDVIAQPQTQAQGPAGPAAPPAAPAAMPTPAQGAQLMALIPPLGAPVQPMYPRPGDPIMQPRPQLPPDRDIPIKGAWFMTGMAFGAVNAGVGGSSYGSHAVQQLLILYANGVAVKSDIMGNNLAGHHQAEGFATLDVTDPSVVGQGGFGHWQQQGQTISINWNYAAPEVLTAEGNALEGGGVKYNPWPLADGQRLEGVFVRPNDPGLHGDAIVLTQNGMFAEDGVNVTMGGTLVMPYFPPRGYGAYEIKKGSLVLHFANGFTVAIALNINGNTLLLNNFGFQRVR
ncbi:MAG TPA: hypothetical protein VKQ70_11430 [Caulobacteraceae bacterium]|nr:hypothetical protein [Caulobacteraceae bacterium]